MLLLLVLAVSSPDPRLLTARAHVEAGNLDAAVVDYEAVMVEATAQTDRAAAYCELARALFRSEDPGQQKRAFTFIDPCRAFAPDDPIVAELELEIYGAAPARVEQLELVELKALEPRLAADPRFARAHMTALREIVHQAFLADDLRAADAALQAANARYSDDATLVCDLGADAAERWFQHDVDEDAARATELLSRCRELAPGDDEIDGLYRAVLVHRAYPWLLGGCVLLLGFALWLRRRRARAAKVGS